MKEIAQVTEISDNLIKVKCGVSGSCKNCSSGFCSVKDRIIEAKNPKNLELEEGDVVEVLVDPGKAVSSGFFVLILPLLAFIGAYLIGEFLLQIPSEGVNAVLGFLGLGAGFGIVFLVNKNTKNKSYPEITRLYGKDMELQEESITSE
ncbi:MAG: SoxR reducing system RseC family protein [Spirochaetia bacterium]